MVTDNRVVVFSSVACFVFPRIVVRLLLPWLHL